MSQRIFVVGPGRSGTSLMWRTVNLDPDVAVTPELHLLDKWMPGRSPAAAWDAFRASEHYARLGTPAGAATPPLGTHHEMYAGILDEYARSRGASVSGEKTPVYFRHLDQLLDWFPQAHIFFVLRDPRGVVGSLVALDTTWSDGSVVEHVRLWRAAAREALRWQEDPRVTIVRYEDFVADPVAILDTQWARLTGRRFDPAWLAANEGEDGSRLAGGSLYGPSRITSERLEVWRARLDPRDAELVMRGCSDLMAPLGYPLDSPLASRRVYLSAALAEDATRVRRALRDPLAFVRRTRLKVRRRLTR